MKNRFWSILLVVCMVFVMLPGIAFAATDDSGSCGDNVTYQFIASTGTLTISGNGAIGGFDTPWYEYRNDILKVVINNGVSEIADMAFAECENLTEVTIPASIKYIGYDVFMSCTSLQEVSVDSGNQNFCDESGVLFNKDKTKIVYYPAGRAATSYSIPASVKTIGYSAFDSAGNLTAISIPAATEEIEDYAFWDCYSLLKIEIPADVEYVGVDVFGYCSDLTEISVDEDNVFYSDVDGVLFDKDKTEIISYPIGKTDKTYTVPDGVESIGISAFSGCKTITKIVLPDSILYINSDAFSHMSALKEIEIGDGLCEVGESAFYRCYNLTDVYYKGDEQQWNSISFDEGNECLTEANIQYNYVPDDGEDDEEENPGGTGEEPEVPGNEPESGIIWNFDSASGVLTISGSGAMEDYDIYEGNTPPWSRHGEYISTIVIEEGVTSIGEDAFNFGFYDPKILYTMFIPSSVNSIGDYIFWSWQSLEYVYYSGSESQWNALVGGRDSFEDSQITFNYNPNADASGTCGENLTWDYDAETGTLTIGGYGKMYDYYDDYPGWHIYKDKILKIKINDNVESISSDAFHFLTKVTEVTLPSHIRIAIGTFYGCSSLKEFKVTGELGEPDGNFYDYGYFDAGYYAEDGVLYKAKYYYEEYEDEIYEYKSLVCYPPAKTDTVFSVPEGVCDIDRVESEYLETINLPASVQSLSGIYCYNLKNIYVDEDNEYFRSVDGVLFYRYVLGLDYPSGEYLLCCPAGREETSYAIPDGVIGIYERAFYGCENLRSITMPESIEYIGEYAFASCYNFTDVYYKGSRTQWDDIQIEGRNYSLYDATIHLAKALDFDISNDILYIECEEDFYDAKIVFAVYKDGKLAQLDVVTDDLYQGDNIVYPESFSTNSLSGTNLIRIMVFQSDGVTPITGKYEMNVLY